MIILLEHVPLSVEQRYTKLTEFPKVLLYIASTVFVDPKMCANHNNPLLCLLCPFQVCSAHNAKGLHT